MSTENVNHEFLDKMLHKLVESQETMLGKLGRLIIDSQESMLNRLVESQEETQRQMEKLMAGLLTPQHQQQFVLHQNVTSTNKQQEVTDGNSNGQGSSNSEIVSSDEEEEDDTVEEEILLDENHSNAIKDKAVLVPSLSLGPATPPSAEHEAKQRMLRSVFSKCNTEFQEQFFDRHQELRLDDLDIPTHQHYFDSWSSNKNRKGKICSSLHEAAKKGDWIKAMKLFKTHPHVLTAPLTEESDTALLVAIENEKWSFVEKLVKIMPVDSLELMNTLLGYECSTALHLAAFKGNTKVAKMMVEKNPNLTQLRNSLGYLPLNSATFGSNRQREMIEYLCTATRDEGHPSPFTADLIQDIIQKNCYDTALSLLRRFPKLVTQKTESGISLLEVIAEQPFAFLSGSKLTPWQRCIYALIPVRLDKAIADHHCGTEEDVENPPDGSKGEEFAPKEEEKDSSSTKSRRVTITSKLHSVFLTCLTQVPGVKKIHNEKLMHGQASLLVKDMFKAYVQLRNLSEQKDLFQNSTVLECALKHRTNEVIEEYVREFPFIICFPINGKLMVQIAIEERNERILNLNLETSGLRRASLISVIDLDGNSLLHYAARLAPSSQLNLVSGAALQMQREVQWFKAVESILPEKHRLKINKDKKTAQSLFAEEHKELVKDGEKWMKDTSQSCMLVAALIATVAFAAAFTVPGGNISDTDNINNGSPIFLNNKSFMVFAIADALALFSSITSLLMFLAVLTSRYAEEDFLKSLPQKMIIGLSTLFISIATIMVAFAAALAIVLGQKLTWVPLATSLTCCVPVALFAVEQFPLFFAMVHSTYWHSIIS